MIEVTKAQYKLRILSSDVICPCPGAIHMYKTMKKIYVKSEFKAVLKLTANDKCANCVL